MDSDLGLESNATLIGTCNPSQRCYYSCNERYQMVMLVDKLLIEILDANCLSVELRAKAINYLETYSDYDPMHLDDFRKHVDNSVLSRDELNRFNEILRIIEGGVALCEYQDPIHLDGYHHEMFPINNNYVRNQLREIGLMHPYIARMAIETIGDQPNRIYIDDRRAHTDNWRTLILANTEMRELVESLYAG